MGQQELTQRVNKLLAVWKANIETNKPLNFYDINLVAEDVAAKLLNWVFNLELENLNERQKNFPGIDLGDTKNKIAFQVTSRNDAKKIKESLEKYVNGPNQTFSKGIKFFIINNKKPKLSRKKYDSICPDFDTDLDILTLDDMTGMGMKIPVKERVLKVLKNPMMLKLYNDEYKAHELPKNLDPTTKASVLWDIAELHREEKDFSTAFSCAREAFSMDNQQDQEVIYKLGIYAAWAGDTDTALSSIERSLELDQTNPSSGNDEHKREITKKDISKFLRFLTADDKSIEQQAIDEVEKMAADVEQLEEAQNHNFLVYTKDQLRRAYEKMKNPSYCISFVWILNMFKLKKIIYWLKDLSPLYKKNDANKKKYSELNQSRQAIKTSRGIFSGIVLFLFVISYLTTAVLFTSAMINSSTFDLPEIIAQILLLWFLFPIEFINGLVYGKDVFLWRFIMGYVTIFLFLLWFGAILSESYKKTAEKKEKSDFENKIMYAERELKDIKDEIEKGERRIKKQLSDIIGE